jgi:hypothetical protein
MKAKMARKVSMVSILKAVRKNSFIAPVPNKTVLAKTVRTTAGK